MRPLLNVWLRRVTPFIVVLAATSAAVAELPSGPTPVIPAAGEDWFGPAWIPASKAFLCDGRTNHEALGETGARSVVASATVPDELEKAAGAPLDKALLSPDNTVHQIDCAVVSFTPRPEFESRPHRTLVEIAQNAVELMVGTVLRSEPGFSFARPGTLYTVEVERILKRSESGDPQARVLVFYPEASFSVAGLAFCRQGWFWGRPPQVGDRLVVARFREWDAADVPLLDARWWELPVILGADGGPSTIARELETDPAAATTIPMEEFLAVEAGGR